MLNWLNATILKGDMIRREMLVPRTGLRRNLNIWKPSQVESFLTTPAEKLPREDPSGTAQQSVHCWCPS